MSSYALSYYSTVVKYFWISCSNSRKASVPPNPTQSVLDEDLDLSGSLFVRNKHRRVSSWRRDIFESVVTSPNSNFKTVGIVADLKFFKFGSLNEETFSRYCRGSPQTNPLRDRCVRKRLKVFGDQLLNKLSCSTEWRKRIKTYSVSI